MDSSCLEWHEKPEKSKTWEIGYKSNEHKFVYFESEIDNLLKYDTNTYVNDTKQNTTLFYYT